MQKRKRSSEYCSHLHAERSCHKSPVYCFSTDCRNAAKTSSVAASFGFWLWAVTCWKLGARFFASSRRARSCGGTKASAAPGFAGFGGDGGGGGSSATAAGFARAAVDAAAVTPAGGAAP